MFYMNLSSDIRVMEQMKGIVNLFCKKEEYHEKNRTV